MSRIFERPGLVVHLDSVRLTEYDDDGFLTVQIDGDGDRVEGAPELEAQVEPFEALHPYGFLSRPLDPDVDEGGQVRSAAQSLTVWEGSRAYSIPLHDARVVPALARCKPGESVQYGSQNNFVRCHDDGRISAMCTDDGTENGKSIFSEVGPSGFTRSAPWGTTREDGAGFYYRHVSGARFELGGISGWPAPLDAVSSSCLLEAHVVTIKGIACKFGTGPFQPAAKATAVLAFDSSVISALNGVKAALSALGAVGINASAGPAITAAVALIEAAAAALTTAQVAVPAQSVLVG